MIGCGFVVAMIVPMIVVMIVLLMIWHGCFSLAVLLRLACVFSAISPLAIHTLWGYIEDMEKESKTPTLKRLGRIEGQVRGLARMVEDERYCIDIVTQIAAVRAALRKVEEEILREHVAHCVLHAIASGDKADQRRKVAELMDVMGRAGR